MKRKQMITISTTTRSARSAPSASSASSVTNIVATWSPSPARTVCTQILNMCKNNTEDSITCQSLFDAFRSVPLTTQPRWSTDFHWFAPGVLAFLDLRTRLLLREVCINWANRSIHADTKVHLMLYPGRHFTRTIRGERRHAIVMASTPDLSSALLGVTTATIDLYRGPFATTYNKTTASILQALSWFNSSLGNLTLRFFDDESIHAILLNPAGTRLHCANFQELRVTFTGSGTNGPSVLLTHFFRDLQTGCKTHTLGITDGSHDTHCDARRKKKGCYRAKPATLSLPIISPTTTQSAQVTNQWCNQVRDLSILYRENWRVPSLHLLTACTGLRQLELSLAISVYAIRVYDIFWALLNHNPGLEHLIVHGVDMADQMLLVTPTPQQQITVKRLTLCLPPLYPDSTLNIREFARVCTGVEDLHLKCVANCPWQLLAGIVMEFAVVVSSISINLCHNDSHTDIYREPPSWTASVLDSKLEKLSITTKVDDTSTLALVNSSAYTIIEITKLIHYVIDHQPLKLLDLTVPSIEIRSSTLLRCKNTVDHIQITSNGFHTPRETTQITNVRQLHLVQPSDMIDPITTKTLLRAKPPLVSVVVNNVAASLLGAS
jgi:hypothetical protein